MESTHCFAVIENGKLTAIDEVHPETGRSAVYGETLEEVQKRYPGATIETWDKFLALKYESQNTPIVWEETTEEKYWEMLEVLPPAIMGKGGFLVGEPWDHCAKTGRPRYQAYVERAKKWYVANRPMTVAEFKEVIDKPIGG